MSVPVFTIDAFTADAFAGNPAAVCLLDDPRPDEWMQRVAMEMNLSETAFVERRHGGFGLRWFTPAAEVALCGHATLASAHALWDAGWLPADQPARFDTRSGTLVAHRRSGGIELDLPAQPVTPCEVPSSVVTALGVRPVFTGRTPERDLKDQDLLFQVDSEAIVRGLRPDFRALRSHRYGCIVTARAKSEGIDFVSRYFAPCWGIDEDPVTGVAHCALAVYWSGRMGRASLVGYQASPRGGVVRTRLEGDRVFLSGPAVTVLRGTLAC